MALKKERVPVPKQVQKRYEQELNKYRKQIEKSEDIQKDKNKAA